jgi:hypothetical protein
VCKLGQFIYVSSNLRVRWTAANRNGVVSDCDRNKNESVALKAMHVCRGVIRLQEQLSEPCSISLIQRSAMCCNLAVHLT